MEQQQEKGEARAGRGCVCSPATGDEAGKWVPLLCSNYGMSLPSPPSHKT